MRTYVFVPYDKKFPSIFSREHAKLKKALPFATEIEHFGSTAVPGLKGKGVIDIYVLIPKDKIFLSKRRLPILNYSFYNSKQLDGGVKMVFRRSYQYAGKIRHIHLHVGTLGVKDFKTCIAFRDKLRADSRICKEYEKVKRKALLKTRNAGEDSKENSYAYVKAKSSFVTKHSKSSP